MGIIEKQIRKRANQRLAEPIYATTTLTVSEVIARLNEICRAHNEETVRTVEKWKTTGNRLSRWANKDKDPMREHYYHVSVRDDIVLIGFRRPPDKILADRRKHPGFDSYWLARMEFPSSDGRERQVSLTLLRWVMDGNSGKLKDRGFYESLIDKLFTAISGPAVGR